MGNITFTPTLNKGVGVWALDITTELPDGTDGPGLHFDQTNPAAQTIQLASGQNNVGLDGNAPVAIPGAPAGTRTLSVAVTGDVFVEKTHNFPPGAFIGDSLTIQVI